MPFFSQQWEEVLSCSVCNRRFHVVRIPTSLVCGHTICNVCISSLHLGSSTVCPLDQVDQKLIVAFLPPNTPMLELLQLDWRHSVALQHRSMMSEKIFDDDEQQKDYRFAVGIVERLAQTIVASSVVNKSIQRKLLTLFQCQFFVEDGRTKAIKASRSICERIVMELILHHQNMQQLTTHLWTAVRARGCQFLGPAMQEEVLKLVLLALETGTALSRKVLVMFIVQKLKPQYAQASKTSVGHVVQLLYRASCFKVSKREGDSSLMELKDEFRTYDALRREHDAQIIQIAQEAGLRIAPEQWSALLYGDQQHKSSMQSIIDKLQTNQSFPQSVQELLIAVQRSGDPDSLNGLKEPLDFIVSLEAEVNSPPTLQLLTSLFSHLFQVVTIYLQFLTDVAQARENALHSRSRKAHLTHSPSFPILEDRSNQMNQASIPSQSSHCSQFNQPNVLHRNFHQPLTASRSLPPTDVLANGIRNMELSNGTNRHTSVFRQSPLAMNSHRDVPSFPASGSTPSFPRQASRMQSSPLQTLNHMFPPQINSQGFFSSLRNGNGKQYESGQEFSSSAGSSPRTQPEVSREFFRQPLSTTWSTPNTNLKFGDEAKGFSLEFKTSMSSSTLMEDFRKWRDDTPSSNGMHRISSFSDQLSTSDSSYGSDGFRSSHPPLSRQYASFGSSASSSSHPFRSLVSHGDEATSSPVSDQNGLSNGWLL